MASEAFPLTIIQHISDESYNQKTLPGELQAHLYQFLDIGEILSKLARLTDLHDTPIVVYLHVDRNLYVKRPSFPKIDINTKFFTEDQKTANA